MLAAVRPLVLAAALAHDWKTASGVEVLDNLHNSALDAHAKLTALESDGVSLAPCNFVHGEAFRHAAFAAL